MILLYGFFKKLYILFFLKERFLIKFKVYYNELFKVVLNFYNCLFLCFIFKEESGVVLFI